MRRRPDIEQVLALLGFEVATFVFCLLIAGAAGWSVMRWILGSLMLLVLVVWWDSLARPEAWERRRPGGGDGVGNGPHGGGSIADVGGFGGGGSL